MKTRRLVTVLLTVVLSVILLAVGASAAEIVDSGNCGDNVTWTLDSEGTLTISGNGSMENYDPYDENQNDEYEGYSMPWESMSDNVQQLVITSGVTGIGDYAFLDCLNMASITLPDSLTQIGAYAFQNCKALTTVKIPDGVTSIGDGAFAGCVGLTSINIPNGVTTLNSILFHNCRSLTQITIPDSVTTIGSGVFTYCSSLTDVQIPEGVTTLGATVFRNCSNLTKVNIPDGITVIGGSVFERCSSLTSLTIPDSVTSIGTYAFSGCSSLTSINIPAGVTEIGDAAFSGCSGITSITIPKGVTVLPREVLKGCGMASITIPAGVTEIGENAFSRCANLQAIIFEGSSPTFGSTPFSEVTATVYYPANDSTWTEDVMQDYGGALTWKTAEAISIKTQPKTGYAKMGETVKVSVKAEGDGLKYQWYIKNAGASKYSKSSVTKSTYSATMSDKVKGRRVYCVITDADGNSVQTKTVILREAVSIVTEPKTGYAKSGKTVKVSVEASGDELTYQWYIKNAGGSKYSKSSITSATYSAKMSDKVHGRRVYCVVTDKYGKTVQTKTVLLRLAATITTQPKDVTVAEGEIAKVKVKAVGDELTYQWYIKNAGSSKFSKSSVTSATYSCKMSEKADGRQVYCVVTDKYGKTAKSETVTLSMSVPAIYLNESGTKYHYDPDCAGKTAYEVTLSEAIAAGRTPCSKCVG